MPGAVDQLDEAVDFLVGNSVQDPRFLTVTQVRWQLRENVRKGLSDALGLLELIGVGARATGILDLLLAHHDAGQIARKLAARAPEIHLKGQRVLTRALLDDPLQRCVRDQASVPVELTLDLDRRETGRKR